jgi:hypothetical protein
LSGPLRVALFVEGADDAAPRTSTTWLERIWNDHLTGAAGRHRFVAVHGISKRNVLALDPDHPPLVGTEALDDMLVRLGAGKEFDAAVVAWDVLPRWDDLPAPCRWEEQVRFYKHLSDSRAIPPTWVEYARRRRDDYRSRPRASQRAGPPSVRPGAILPLCMDPEFESLLVGNEAAVKRAFGLEGSVRDWPNGWGSARSPRRGSAASGSPRCQPTSEGLRRLEDRPRTMAREEE